MKTLVIHADDPSTTFLKGIYSNLKDKTVITGGITKYQLQEYIENHSRVILCGHGSPNGLFAVDQFPDAYPYIIDDTMVSSLRNKATILYIWCNADQFVRRHSLNGFYTGMFCSEENELCICGLGQSGIDNTLVDESNNVFAEIVARYLNEPMDILYTNVIRDYGELAKMNPVARYNNSRLFLNQFKPDLFGDKVRKTA
jgi:hypothetical protein